MQQSIITLPSCMSPCRMWPLKSGKKAATHASIAVCTMGPASGRHALDIDAARCICAHTLTWHATQNRSAAWIVICGPLRGSSSFLGFLLRLSSAFLTRDPKQIEPNTIQEARPIAHAHELRTSFKLCATRVCFLYACTNGPACEHVRVGSDLGLGF